MKNITKTTQTILFASLIVAMILPFSGMQFAEAKVDKIGKDIVKAKASFDNLPKDQKERKALLKEKHNSQAEIDVRIQQDILVDFLIENYQTTDKNAKNYFPWTSMGYDYEDNALEVTLLPGEFNKKDIKKYQKIIRSVVGKSIDVTISPAERSEGIACYSRTNCDDLESGVEIGMTGKDFPCTLGFAATWNDESGFITAGHCFASLSTGADSSHPENGGKIGDMVDELYGPNTYLYCDCAFVEGTQSISGNTYGLGDATTTGSSSVNKAIKSSTSQSGVTAGNIDATYVHLSTSDGRYWIGVVRTDMSAQDGDSGAGVFSSNGDELLGILVAATESGTWSWYVKHDKVTQYFSGLDWDF